MKPPRFLSRVLEQDPNKQVRYFLEQTAKVLGGNVSFGSTVGNTDQEQNIECHKAAGTTPGVANTEFSVAHSLSRIPITLAGWDTDNGGVLYRSVTAWTKTTVFLKCTTASANYKLVLI